MKFFGNENENKKMKGKIKCELLLAHSCNLSPGSIVHIDDNSLFKQQAGFGAQELAHLHAVFISRALPTSAIFCFSTH